MNIKSIINKLFNNKIYESSIINLGDIIQIPKRNDIENQQLLLNIDKYKKEYLDILNTKGYLLPNMLSSKEIQDEMKINIDLIVKLYLEDTETTNDKISLITKYLRLKLYLDKVTELGNVVLARLIALKEIFNEKIIISKHKRQRISYEINNLLSILVTFNSQRSALENEYNLYHGKLISSNIDLNLTDEELSEVNKKLEDVCELVKSVMPNINTNEYQGISGLVALERMLEIYVYQNKDIVDDIKEQVKRLSLIYFDLLEDSKLRDELYKDLRNIEISYRIFYEYGRNIITDDEMYELYKLKFSILTHQFGIKEYIFKKVLNEKTTKKEYECYIKIVSEIVEYLVQGKPFFEPDIRLVLYQYERQAVKYMIKVLKDGTNSFNFEKILNSDYLFNALCTFRDYSYSNISMFFKNYRINPKNNMLYPIYVSITELHEATFSWEDNLPLETIFRIDDINEQIIGFHCISDYSKEKCMDSITYMKKLYLLYQNNLDRYLMEDTGIKEFYLPEGIKEIKYPTQRDAPFLYKLMSYTERANIYFPKSLIKLYNGNLFKNVIVNEIHLNEGLEELDSGIFNGQYISKITIPSSIQKIKREQNFGFPSNILTIEIINFKESHVFNNIDTFKKFLNHCMTISKLGSVYFKVTKIILIDENNKSYSINLKRIEKESNRIDYCTSQEMQNIVIEIFKEEVYKQTGFMLGEDNIDILEESGGKVLTRKMN